MRVGRLVVVALAAGALGWLLWPSEEGRVRAHLDALAKAASRPVRETDFERVARIAVLARGLAQDAVFDPGGGRSPVTGRDAIAALASRAAPSGPWEIRLADVVVSLGEDGRSAEVDATVIARGDGSRSDALVDAQEVRFDLRRIEGQWLVTGALVVAALERPR